MSTTTETTTAEVSSAPGWTWIILLGVVFVIIAGKFYWDNREDDTSARNNPPPATPTVVEPIKMRATTPATITADYGFSLEADGPIMVQYPGEKEFLFDPRAHGGCQQLPQPRNSGPKKFWDPSDPENGHISFRIYRGRGVC